MHSVSTTSGFTSGVPVSSYNVELVKVECTKALCVCTLKKPTFTSSTPIQTWLSTRWQATCEMNWRSPVRCASSMQFTPPSSGCAAVSSRPVLYSSSSDASSSSSNANSQKNLCGDRMNNIKVNTDVSNYQVSQNQVN